MLDQFIAEAQAASGGAERSNYQIFVQKLCEALDVAPPGMAGPDHERNDYVFERRVDFKHPDGTTTPGYIDCYKRDHFILEAKQSKRRQISDAPARKRAHPGWDRVMAEARRQAENYARALPVDHGYPPFLITVDVGQAIEIYADFSGLGKNYAHFPDRNTYRITLEDLRRPEIRKRLRTIFTAPRKLDPTRHAARVTRVIAARLARVARRLEKRHDPAEVAQFLMRCLFTMFAEDSGLLPERGFRDLLEQLRQAPENTVPALTDLWCRMDSGGYEPRLMATIKRFNGTLFKDATALPLESEELAELAIAASRDWREVEPAIFGTLLERALDTRERARLGAHYTPRAYVERLVVPTILDPLRVEWDEARTRADVLHEQGDDRGAITVIRAFHHRLCSIRVLDPACGTGNFLYVALEMLKRLEGEVLEALDALGEDQARLAMEGETVSPKQFYGLELNPRAVAIADLVLWIGYIKWQRRTTSLASLPEPILQAYGTIRHQDAILDADAKIPRVDDSGAPVTKWDRFSHRPHPVSGDPIPDPNARIPVYDYRNPRPARWPEVEFIIGNPPFIGGKDMREELGDGYTEACRKAHPKVPGGADFVMHFWDEAAVRLLRRPTKQAPNPLIRFGFITTNSITQTFSRRVIERHLEAREPLSLIYAIPDHPWLKAPDKAAVRIAMTVCERGRHEGVLETVTEEADLKTDTPRVELARSTGMIRAKLTLGADLSQARALAANEALCSRGVVLHGAGFMVTPLEAKTLGLGRVKGLDAHIRDYRNGRDLAGRPRGVKVIDLYPLAREEVEARFPAVYQHVLERVKPERDQNNMKFRRENWWWFGATHKELRAFLDGLPRYITTIETAKHRFFQFLDGDVRPDNKLINIGSDDAALLAVLSSSLHCWWFQANAGKIGVYALDSVYVKTRVFDTFPFPPCLDPRLPEDHSQAALRTRLRKLGEKLDAFRKERIAAHSFITMTGLYNALEQLRLRAAGLVREPMSEAERDFHEAGLISVLAEIHDEIDAAVLEAYGLEHLAPALIGQPGATTPLAQEKPAALTSAEEELLSALVALNQERQREEQQGRVRWLRPDFQIPRLAHKLPEPPDEQLFADLVVAPQDLRIKWPKNTAEQLRLVRRLLIATPSPAPDIAIAEAFSGKGGRQRRAHVRDALEALTARGIVRKIKGEPLDRYFIPR
jgi:SAM-dependent methyltransferase